MSTPAARPLPPWMTEAWQRVQHGRRVGGLGHAQLISGLAGVGKRHFAERLAASLLCERVADDGLACGACRSCLQMAGRSQPNLIVLERQFDDKNERLKRDIAVEQVRELIERLTLVSHYGQARVVIIDPLEALNAAGVNALLKTIEEPPANTFVLLLSTRPNGVLATLRSRCQQIRLAPPQGDVALAWMAQLGPDVAALRKGLAIDDPWLAAPFRLLSEDAGELLSLRRQWQQGLQRVAVGDENPVDEAAKVVRDKDYFGYWLELFQHQLALQLRALRGMPVSVPALPADEEQRLLALLDEANDCVRRAGSSLQPQLAADSLLIGWWRLFRSQRSGTVGTSRQGAGSIKP